LANIKSQIKRNRTNEKKRLRNRNYRGAARTAVNQARFALEEGTPDTREAVLKAISLLDKAAERGVIHRNNASRRKGRLMKRLAAMGGTQAAVAEPAVKAVEEPKAKKAPAKKVAEPKAEKPVEKKAAEKKPAEKKPAAKKPAAKKAPAKK
jgi:small subunit ribosomal protein S20